MATISDIDPKNPNKIKGVDWGLVPIPKTYADLYKNFGDPRSASFEEDFLITLSHRIASGKVIPIKAHIAMTTALHDLFYTCGSLIKDCGGAYNFRAVRGDNSAHPALSLHSWGLAIDLNVADNPQYSTRRDKQPKEIIDCLCGRHGFFWGADFKKNKDPMHFERAVDL